MRVVAETDFAGGMDGVDWIMDCVHEQNWVVVESDLAEGINRTDWRP